MPPNTTTLYWTEWIHGFERPSLVNATTGLPVSLMRVSDNSTAIPDRYRIMEPLSPSTRYTLGDGTTYFTTAASADTAPPPPPSLTGFGIEKEARDLMECGLELYHFAGELLVPGAAVLVARFGAPGSSLSTTYYLDPDAGFSVLGTYSCATWFDVPTGTDVTLTLWTEDVAGNRSAEVSAATRVVGCGYQECEEAPDPDEGGGCSTGRASAGGLLGLLALRRRRRLA